MLSSGELARYYDITDIDGTQPDCWRYLDDRTLVDEIRQRALPLEVCPSSNVALGFVPSLSAHPLPRLREAGLAVTVNADIPAVIGTSPTAEYTRVRDTFGYDDTVLA